MGQLVAATCSSPRRVVLCAVCAGASGPGKVGYVRLATFNSNTTAAAQEALYDLQKQGVAGLVLDIRNNGGGLFPAGKTTFVTWQHAVPLVRTAGLHAHHCFAPELHTPGHQRWCRCMTTLLLWCAGVNVARMLIDQGDLVLIADNQGVRDIYSADGNSIDKSTPLVVLVNKGTASASEVSGQAGPELNFFGSGLRTDSVPRSSIIIRHLPSAALCDACAAARHKTLVPCCFVPEPAECLN